jgi:hypothetical protein
MCTEDTGKAVETQGNTHLHSRSRSQPHTHEGLPVPWYEIIASLLQDVQWSAWLPTVASSEEGEWATA